MCLINAKYSMSVVHHKMASDCKAGESGEALATDLRFLLHNLKNRGPSPVQAKGFRATIITIRFVNKALHQTKQKKKKTDLASRQTK